MAARDGEPPSLMGWRENKLDGPVESLSLVHGADSVRIETRSYDGDRGEVARDELEQHLRAAGARTAARLVVEASACRLDGTIDALPATFVLVAAGGCWAAVGQASGYSVIVSGEGDPPDHLELEHCEPDTLSPNPSVG